MSNEHVLDWLANQALEHAAGQPKPQMGIFGAVEKAVFSKGPMADTLGTGPGWSGGFEWRVTKAVGLEIEIGRGRHAREAQGSGLLSVLGSEGRYSTVTARLSRAFGSQRVRPELWGGGGLTHYSGETLHNSTLRGERARNGFAADGGVGAHLGITEHIGVRPYVGLRVGEFWIASAGVRIAVRW